MTLKQACKILGVSKADSDREIKSKYKKLLIIYHPDSDPGKERSREDDEKLRQIIEAYRIIRESEDKTSFETYEFTWDAFENKDAFALRNIYFQFKIFDEELPLSKMARGRFVWDPDMEEFGLFAKSVLEACREMLADYDLMPSADLVKDVFHLMMQEYVLPADSARKIGKLVQADKDKEIYSFNGFIRMDHKYIKSSLPAIGEPMNIFLREDRAVVEEIVTGKIVGSVSFDQDALYYVVLPLLEDMRVDARAVIKKVDNSSSRKGILHIVIELAIPRNLTDIPVNNRALIESLLQHI
ncbi:J domain-containing protein [Butyrivibrio sp. MC2013]|uniref:J domain-containing protein n=1 Tax=Butyrivibrio sp. MC2013 TaxID=1280686 RepID=UPI00040515F9|nr:DnaJ domain-containing protein [Butyrivibrio sp. MC2013]